MVNYIKYDRYPKNIYNLDIKTIDQKSHKKTYNKEEERQVLDLDFGDMPEKLKGEYLDMYEGVQSKVISTTRFDENSDLSTTYLSRVDTTRANITKQKKGFLYQSKGIQ